MVQTLPTYIALPDAAQRYHISEEALNQAIEEGAIHAVRTPGGDILVAGEDLAILNIEAWVEPELTGTPIRVTEAAEKYQIGQKSLSRWAYAGHIRILEQGPKLLVLDEADVKRAAAIFHRAQQETGSFVRAGWVLKRVLTHALAQG